MYFFAIILTSYFYLLASMVVLATENVKTGSVFKSMLPLLQLARK